MSENPISTVLLPDVTLSTKEGILKGGKPDWMSPSNYKEKKKKIAIGTIG